MEAGRLRPGDPTRLGAYDLVGRLGEGGQGTVYQGVDGGGRKVAVKLLHPDLTADEKARARFVREVEVAKAVAGFCTAQVIDVDLDGDRPYIVTEYVPGPSLHSLVQEGGPLVEASLERLAVGTATALVAIHQADIVHRDFKPHNVLIGPDGPRVIDFGISRALSGSTTLTSRIIGTPAYLAPEQLRGTSAGKPADVFCWAATMVFAATGRPPFGQDTIPAVINRILHEDPELGAVTGSLRDLIVDCLAKDPGVRPQARDVLLRLLGHGVTGPGAAGTAGAAAAGDEAGAGAGAGAGDEAGAGEVAKDDATAILAQGSVLAAELDLRQVRKTAPTAPPVAPAEPAAPGGGAEPPSPAEWARLNTLQGADDQAATHGSGLGAGPRARRPAGGVALRWTLTGTVLLAVAIIMLAVGMTFAMQLRNTQDGYERVPAGPTEQSTGGTAPSPADGGSADGADEDTPSVHDDPEPSPSERGPSRKPSAEPSSEPSAEPSESPTVGPTVSPTDPSTADPGGQTPGPGPAPGGGGSDPGTGGGASGGSSGGTSGSTG